MSRLDLTSWQRKRLRRQLVETLDARVLRRTLAVLEYDRGRSAQEVAQMLGVTRQSIYHWLARYLPQREPSSLQDEEGRGRRPVMDEDEEHALEALLALAPQELGYPHANWTVPLLREALEIATGQGRFENTLRRALRRLDYVWKRPRYDLEPDVDQEKKTKDSQANPGFAAAQRGAGAGRNRLVALSPPARRLVPLRRGGPGLAERPQCLTGDLRSPPSAHRRPAVGSAGERTQQ